MGSFLSKTARGAAVSSARKYPSRVPPTSTLKGAKSAEDPTSQANETKSEAINRDDSDPVFASKLRTIGVVSSNPFQSNTSTNPLEQSRSAPKPSASSLTPDPAPSSRRPQEPLDTYQPPLEGAFPHPLNNPAIAMLDARQKLQEQADKELQRMRRPGFEGRSLVDTGTIQQILSMRDVMGMSEEDIEKRLELKRGTVKRLGPKGLVEGLSN